MKIIYIAGFNVLSNNGRNKATREKVAALKGIAGKSNVRFIYPRGSGNKILLYLNMLLFDLRLFSSLFFVNRDTIIVQRQVFFPLTMSWLYLRQVAVISELHTESLTEIPFLNKSRPEKMMLLIAERFERYNLRLSKGIIYNHPELQEVMQQTYHQPSISSYNGADCETFVIRDRVVCRQELNLQASSHYFLFLGSLVKWRGVEMLIEVFNQDILKIGDHYLLIVGATNDAYSRQLKKMAAGNSRIIFVDHVDLNTAISYINASDICLVPVKKIMTTPGNALKLYDYIACGKPVVTQERVMGYADEVLKYKLGMVTDFSDGQRAARDLVLFNKTLDRESYQLNNRNIAANSASWKKRMEEWIIFFNQI